jgi:hypothetical protein
LETLFTMAPASSTNANGTNECLEQLFHKLLAISELESDSDSHQPNQPYLFLVQHTQSFHTRQTAATTAHRNDKDEAVYRRAGLRTPAENARRDFAAGQLWLQYIVNELKKEQSTDILWVQTSSRRWPVWLNKTAVRSAAARGSSSSSSKIQVMDAAAVDPFGWDDDNESSSSSTGLLNDLDHLATCIENHVRETVNARKHQSPESSTEPASISPAITTTKRIPIVLESLTPLIMRHGLDRTVRFLERLCRTAACPLIVAVRTETLLEVQHQVLEDLAQATLCLRQGEAVLLRQGVREKGHMVRENLPYRMTSSSSAVDGGSCTGSTGSTTGVLTRLQVISAEEEDARPTGGGGGSEPTDYEHTVPEAPVALQALSLAANANTTAANPTAAATALNTSNNRPKVKMELQDDDGPRKQVTLAAESSSSSSSAIPDKASTAHIYIQEDDAEYQDYDEEDPDDDLDI